MRKNTITPETLSGLYEQFKADAWTQDNPTEGFKHAIALLISRERDRTVGLLLEIGHDENDGVIQDIRAGVQPKEEEASDE